MNKIPSPFLDKDLTSDDQPTKQKDDQKTKSSLISGDDLLDSNQTEMECGSVKINEGINISLVIFLSAIIIFILFLLVLMLHKKLNQRECENCLSPTETTEMKSENFKIEKIRVQEN